MAKMTLPLLITKSFVIFPEQKNIQVDAGRDFSIKAIDASRDLNSSLLLVVAQKDPSIEVPTQKDICQVGTLCRITSYSNMKNYIRVHITGTKRVKINNLSFDASGHFVADAETIEDVVKDEKRVLAYCKNIITALVNTPQVSNVVPRTTFAEITTKGVEPTLLCDILAPYIPLTDEGRMKILNELDLVKRLELVLKAKKGDTEAITTLLEKYKGIVKAVARSMFLAGGDTDDLIQEGTLGILKAIETYNGKSSFSSYAYLCVKSKILSMIKKPSTPIKNIFSQFNIT